MEMELFTNPPGLLQGALGISLASRRGISHPLYTTHGQCMKGLTVRVVRACVAAVFFGLLLSPKCGGVTPRFAAGFPRRRQAGVGELAACRERAHEATRVEAVGEGTEAPHEVQYVKSCGEPRTCP